jgi:hypothetical protein
MVGITAGHGSWPGETDPSLALTFPWTITGSTESGGSMSQLMTRRALTASSLTGVALAFGTSGAGTGRFALAQTDGTPVAEGTPTESLVGEVVAPEWRFAVTIFEDPYRGTITTPSEPPPGTRYIGVEVVITNNSEQPLEFRVPNVRLLDDRGFNYAAGDVQGTEPRLVSQNLPDLERTRGWVWFMVPADAVVSAMIFNGPIPTFRVPVSSGG